MITGLTRIVHVIADPVFQIKTPQALNDVWTSRGIDMVTVPAHVSEQNLTRFVEGMRADASVAGAVVTIPHKQAVVALLDELADNAQLVGAVNAIRRESDGRLRGETFDGLGFVAGLRSAGIDPAGLSVRLLGAGGAASAVAAALADAGVSRLRIENRTASRAAALADRIRDRFGLDDVEGSATAGGAADLLINATSQGMSPGDENHVDLSSLPSDSVVAEVVVSAEHTPLLAAAAARGLRTHEGRRMLVGQVELIADFVSAP